MNLTRSLALAAILLSPLLRAESPLKIENALYAVEYDPSSAEFSIIHKPSGKNFAKNGKLENGGGKAAVISVKDKTFGEGQAIEIISPNGNSDRITLCPDLPFVLFSGSLYNGTSEPVVHNKVRTVSTAVESGAALSEVKTLGTGGLLSPDKNPGSYAFLTIADPASRSGVIGGWISHDRGSGVVFSPVADGAVRMQAQIDYGKLRIKPGADADTETFAMGWFDDARIGLESYADAIAQVYSVKLPRQQAGFCTWYMEKHAGACDEVHLPQVSAVAARELKPFGFDFILIDDEWQDGIKVNGPKKNFTTHAPNGPYSGGMKKAQEGITNLGLVPGIWFMPIAGTHNDPHFKDRQDWFDGKTYAKGIGAHADAISVYDIPEKATRFVAVVGIDDSQKEDPRSSVVFEVYGNVKEMGEKPALIARSPVLSNATLRNWAFDLEMNTRFKELHLVVTDAGDGIAADHANWVDAGFIIGTKK